MKKLFFLCFVFISCSNSIFDYKNVTSSSEDISFYKLTEVENYDNTIKITLSIPKFLNQVSPPDEKTVFQYTYFEDKTGYMVSMDKLATRNTQKLSDKEYIDITNKWFETDLKSDLSEIGKVLPPTMKNVKVVQFEGNLIINDKFFLKRVSYYNDQNLVGTILEDVNCTEFHFVTLHNKKKYSLNIIYWGNDKDISSLIGLFNTIGGSLKFN